MSKTLRAMDQQDCLSEALLRDLIEHFSRIQLGNCAAQADVLGQSYEYLIKKFADATNKKFPERPRASTGAPKGLN